MAGMCRKPRRAWENRGATQPTQLLTECIIELTIVLCERLCLSALWTSPRTYLRPMTGIMLISKLIRRVMPRRGAIMLLRKFLQNSILAGLGKDR